MQKAVNLSENDCFAADAVHEAEETDIPVSSVSIGGRPRWNIENRINPIWLNIAKNIVIPAPNYD